MKSACLLLLTLTAATAANGSIDFTPATGERTLDGIKFKQLIFKENGHKITYEQPRDWAYFASGATIKFVPPEIPQAYAEIEQVHLQAPQNFDDATVKALQDQTLQSVSTDSTGVALVSAEKNPVVMNQHETYEVIVTYQLHGQDCELSVLYLNLPDTQLKFRCVARKADFEKVHKAFRGSLFSWQWQG
jgi:hypothetical protein